ncbi:MAG: hypothetical protein NTX38_00095 [Methylobacter sp.]|nr:hypothetical protein [Methylobacter sp.]
MLKASRCERELGAVNLKMMATHNWEAVLAQRRLKSPPHPIYPTE